MLGPAAQTLGHMRDCADRVSALLMRRRPPRWVIVRLVGHVAARLWRRTLARGGMQDLARWKRRPERVGALARIPAVLGAAGNERQRRFKKRSAVW
jgi:hypothetical protein